MKIIMDKWFTIYKWKLITSERINQIEKYLEYSNDLSEIMKIKGN